MAVSPLRHTLQREIFTPREQRLLAVSFVWKASRKRKSAILCAAVSSEQKASGEVVLMTVKAAKSHYKLNDCWPASELTLVDGIDAVKETAEFHLHLDKVYKWVSSSSAEKKAFVTCLWKINQRYLQDKVQFLNISPAILEEVLPWQHGREAATPESKGAEEEVEEEDFQELTLREAADVQRLMEESDGAMQDAQAFAQTLHANLASMDQENFQSLMETERQGEQLLSLLDEALLEVTHIEEVLSHYDELLHGVQKQINILHTSSAWLQRIDRNHSQLCSELCQLVDWLSVREEHLQVLTKGDLENEEQMKGCVEAVWALSQGLYPPLSTGQRRLQGVAEQLIRFESVRQTFELRLCRHITNAVILQGLREGENGASTEPWKPNVFHVSLMRYKPLMEWLKESNPVILQQLSKVYAENICKLYERQMKDLFDAARLQFCVPKDSKKIGVISALPDSVTSAAGCMASVSRSTPVSSYSEGQASMVIQQVLNQLGAVCIKEQEFLTSFFGLNSSSSTVAFHAGRRSSVVDQTQNSVTREQKKRPHSWIRMSASFEPLEPCMEGWDCIQAVLGSAEPRLCALLSSCEKCAQQHSQHSLCTYAESLCREVESPQVLKRTRGGILPFISRLEDFMYHGKAILMGEEERWGLDSLYAKLLKAAVHTLEKLSGSNARSGPLVVRLLNYHRLVDFLEQLGLSGLDKVHEEAKERMMLHLRHYMAMQMGQPLGLLSDFLDGVQGHLAHGVQEEEVGFQLAYSKQELRRVAERYTSREVQRTLEASHRRLNRELADCPRLLQEVWNAMKTAFLEQYREAENLIKKCYPGAGISLDFTEQDLLEYFSTISKDSPA
ncbi:exocyst complex component 1-like isoform X2 [Brienomyrus brachyistius]|uniref:exocyst complex component 1-like isoform X2 n=1 Tax=Brienomyrus brachyistius TaxID=42636 RepID=UPI0020B28BBC|nr:exocyst complex component 1-like isoform X2 [Brienomyrus brachyistius]